MSEKNKCKDQFTKYECLIALKQMKTSKSPGLVQIVSLLSFTNHFGKILRRSYIKYVYNNQNKTELQKQGLIALLPKPNKVNGNQTGGQ